MSSNVSLSDADYKYNLPIANEFDQLNKTAPEKIEIVGTLWGRKLVVVTKDDPIYRRFFYAILKFIRLLNTDVVKFNAILASVKEHQKGENLLRTDKIKQQEKKIMQQELLIKRLETETSSSVQVKSNKSFTEIVELLENNQHLTANAFLENFKQYFTDQGKSVSKLFERLKKHKGTIKSFLEKYPKGHSKKTKTDKSKSPRSGEPRKSPRSTPVDIPKKVA